VKTKEIIVKDCIIVIDNLVKQTGNKLGFTNEPICFLVTIKDPLSKGQTMFRADSVKELWKMIEQESRLWL
jgi:hypothetical protein